jgi:hypothetical protein
MQQLLSERRREEAASSARSPVGSWERPDPAGIVRRGEAVGFRRYLEKFGEPPACFVGWHRGGTACERPAVMEVYGLRMCGIHGEEAAAGALEEIAFDIEQKLQRPLNPYVRGLSPHIEAALRHGFESLPSEAGDADDYGRTDAALLEAFPLDRDRTNRDSIEYARDRSARARGLHESPFDAYMGARLLLCRHMRLAFEESAHWLVEMLEAEREAVAAQAAYALALEIEAGLQPAPGGAGDAGEASGA